MPGVPGRAFVVVGRASSYPRQVRNARLPGVHVMRPIFRPGLIAPGVVLPAHWHGKPYTALRLATIRANLGLKP
jgi:hypothetical protein